MATSERLYLTCPYMHPDLWVREARLPDALGDTSACAQTAELSGGVTTEILFAQKQGLPVEYIDLEQIMNETTGLMNMN